MTSITEAKNKALRQVGDVRELLYNDQALAQLNAVAALHLRPERMMRVVANAIRNTPGLQECDPLSFLGALMECASLGLEPNGRLGHAYLVPFKNSKKKITECQLIIGYKGFIDLALRHDAVVNIHADIHYSDDPEWSFSYGTRQHLHHVPGPQHGEKLHAYCHVKLRDGEAFVVLPWEVVMKTREASQGWRYAVSKGKEKEHPWHVYEDRMAAKTAVRALANRGELPVSVELMDAFDLDNRQTGFAQIALNPNAPPEIDGEVQEDKSGETEAVDPDKKSGKGDDQAKAKSSATRRGGRGAGGKSKADAEGKSAAKPTSSQAEASGKGNAVDIDQKQVDDVTTRLLSEIADCEDDGSVAEFEEMFRDQLHWLQAVDPAKYGEVQDAVTARREALA